MTTIILDKLHDYYYTRQVTIILEVLTTIILDKYMTTIILDKLHDYYYTRQVT